MPSGKVHSQVAAATIAIGGAWVAFQPVPIEVKASVVGGLVAGWIMTPDLDLPTRTHEEKRMMRIPIFGRMWISFWASYGWMFNHRGISHWPVIGTATRLFWLLRYVFMFAAFAWLLVRSGAINITINVEPTPLLGAWFAPFFIAWSFQDALHFAADLIVSDVKQRSRK